MCWLRQNRHCSRSGDRFFRQPNADQELAAVAHRVPLPATANERSGITFDAGLLAYALAKVTLEDDVGPKILTRQGHISRDIDLEF
jgi:hypothetical protein